MSDHDDLRQPTPPAEPPSPFDRPAGDPARESAPLEPGGRRSGTGVGKPLLIGCGCLVLLGIIALAALFFMRNDLLVWFFETMHPQVESRLPDDVTPVERERFDRAWNGAIEVLEEGADDQSLLAVQRVQQRLTGIVQLPPGEPMGRETFESLLTDLEAVAGLDPPAGAPRGNGEIGEIDEVDEIDDPDPVGDMDGDAEIDDPDPVGAASDDDGSAEI